MAFGKSIIFSQIRGSIGDLTFLQTPGRSMVIRDRVVPVDPNTANQQSVRSILGTASAAWGGLSQSLRDGWDEYGKRVRSARSIGRLRMSGFHEYVSVRAFHDFAVARSPYAIMFNDAFPVSQGALGVHYSPQFTLHLINGRSGFTVTNPNSEIIILFVQRVHGISPSINFYVAPWPRPVIDFFVIAAGAPRIVIFSEVIGLVTFYRLTCLSFANPMRRTPPYYLRSVGAII